VVWSQMRFVQWKPSEISKDLRKQGIYVDGLRPGCTTSNLLKIIINKLVLFWYVIVLFFNVVFDNLFSNLPFSNWFGGVNIGVDLIRQIRTKYRYIYANN
jgi:preprotein translocase subunit SecY